MENQPEILIVEDDLSFRTRLAKALAKRGYFVLEATNLVEALAKSENTENLSAIIDLKVGQENGLVILEKLKDKIPNINAVVLTGYGTIATTVQALKLGAINYLTKPTDVDTILEALFAKNLAIKEDELKLPELENIEWDYIQRVLKECEGNVTQAAKILGLHRRSLQRKLARPPAK
jgi:two-component system response regulator RegA